MIRLPFSNSNGFPHVRKMALNGHAILTNFQFRSIPSGTVFNGGVHGMRLHGGAVAGPNRHNVFLSSIKNDLVLFSGITGKTLDISPSSKRNVFVHGAADSGTTRVAVTKFRTSHGQINVRLTTLNALTPTRTPGRVIAVNPDGPTGADLNLDPNTALAGDTDGGQRKNIRVIIASLNARRIALHGAAVDGGNNSNLAVVNNAPNNTLADFRRIRIHSDILGGGSKTKV